MFLWVFLSLSYAHHTTPPIANWLLYYSKMTQSFLSWRRMNLSSVFHQFFLFSGPNTHWDALFEMITQPSPPMPPLIWFTCLFSCIVFSISFLMISLTHNLNISHHHLFSHMKNHLVEIFATVSLHYWKRSEGSAAALKEWRSLYSSRYLTLLLKVATDTFSQIHSHFRVSRHGGSAQTGDRLVILCFVCFSEKDSAENESF